MTNPNIETIKETMQSCFGFILTEQQITDYLASQAKTIDLDFDTVERSDFADYLGEKITGMSWPLNGDSQERKDKFYKLLKDNYKSFGYVMT